MSNRTNYLAYLAAQGYTPNRALTFEEGTGQPVDFYTSETTGGGGGAWITNGTYGTGLQMDGTADNYTLANSSSFQSTTAETILVIRRCTDTTLRASCMFAVNTSSDAARSSSNCPWSDGKIYFDFGGASGNNRLVYTGYSKQTTNLEAWAFRAGASGMRIWKDGSQLATSATAVTRSADNGVTNVNAAFLTAGDLAEFYFICWVPSEVSDAVLTTFTVDNVLLSQALTGATITNAATLNTPSVKYVLAPPTIATAATVRVPSVLRIDGAPGSNEIHPLNSMFRAINYR